MALAKGQPRSQGLSSSRLAKGSWIVIRAEIFLGSYEFQHLLGQWTGVSGLTVSSAIFCSLFVQSVVRSRIGTSAQRLAKVFFSTNQKCNLTSLIFSYQCGMFKRFFNSFVPQLTIFLSAGIYILCVG